MLQRSSGARSSRPAASASLVVHLLPRIVVEQVGPWYPEVVANADEIERVVRAEEERFRETIDRGMREFEELSGGDISAGDAFRLAATYGFPTSSPSSLRASAAPGRRRRLPRRDGASQGDLTGNGERGLAQRAADFARDAGFASEFVGYGKVDVLTQTARSMTSATGRSSPSSARRLLALRAAAR